MYPRFIDDSSCYRSSCYINFRGAKRKEDRLRVRGARHVSESQRITLEVDRRISFSIAIRAWEEFISVASVPRILSSRNKLKRPD